MKIRKKKKSEPSFDVDIEISRDPVNKDIEPVKKISNGRKGIAAFIAAVVIFGGIGAGVDSFSKVTVPDVEGIAAYSAEKRLIESGFGEEDITFTCGKELTEEEIQHGEYRVIDQSVGEGERVNTDDGIVIQCEDVKANRIEKMTDCRYGKASDAISTAESYQFSYELNDLNGDDITNKYASLSPVEQEKYFVFEQTVFNDDRRVTSYTIDTEDKIVEQLESTFKECKGDSTSAASSVAENLNLDLTYEDGHGSSITAGSNYVVTGFGSVDLDTREVVLDADSKEHIAEVKLLKKIKKKIPYKGLDEKYIGRTAVGKPDYEDEDYDEDEDEVLYTWESDDGKYDVLEVVCTDGKVTSVKKKYKKVYWKDKLPDFSADKDEYDAKQAAKKAEKEKAKLEASLSGSNRYVDSGGSGGSVWIPSSGQCYHSNPNCSGMKNPRQVSQSEAENWGYRPCKKCY